MRAITCASTTLRPSSPRLEAKVPGMTENSTKMSSATARRIGNICRTRRRRNANIAIFDRVLRRPRARRSGRLLRGRRGVVDPDALVVLEGELGGVRLQPVQPGLIGHYRLVVVEEPHRRFLVDDAVDLLQRLDLLRLVVHDAGLVE